MSALSARLRQEAATIWTAQHEHPFVRGIGNGTLPEEVFRFYVRQDYLFLIDYGRLLALGAVRAPRLEWMRRFAALSLSVLHTEMDLHRTYSSSWGISPAELEAESPAPATAGYADFLLRTAAIGDFTELAAALLPCMWGYAEIGERLAAAGPPEDARYAEWIAMYAGEDFQLLAGWCRELVDEAGAEIGPAGYERMRRAFLASSQHELAFWEAAWTSA